MTAPGTSQHWGPAAEQAERDGEEYWKSKPSSCGVPLQWAAETGVGRDGASRKGCLPPPTQAHLLEVDVGTDKHVIEQEDPTLLGLN